MDYRQGTCSSCKKSFRVPASFAPNRAKCPQCGGVVELGAVKSAAPPAAKESSAPAEPAVAPSPAAAAEIAAEPTKPAASAPAPTAVRKESVRATTEAAAQRVKSGARGHDGEHHGHGHEHGHAHGHHHAPHHGHHHHHAPPKKSNGMLFGIIAGVVIVGGGLVAFLNSGNEPAKAAPTTAPAADPAYDLSVYAEIGKPASQAENVWVETVGAAARYPHLGPSEQQKALHDMLLERKVTALPALLNKLRTLNLSKPEDHKVAVNIHGLVSEICGGRTFGWKAASEPDYLAANRAAVEAIYSAYRHAGESPEAWNELITAPQN